MSGVEGLVHDRSIMGMPVRHAHEVESQLDHPCSHAEAVEVGRGPVSVRAGLGRSLDVIVKICYGRYCAAVSHGSWRQKR